MNKSSKPNPTPTYAQEAAFLDNFEKNVIYIYFLNFKMKYYDIEKVIILKRIFFTSVLNRGFII